LAQELEHSLMQMRSIALVIASVYGDFTASARNWDYYAERNAAEGPHGAHFGPDASSHLAFRAQRCHTPASHEPVAVPASVMLGAEVSIDWRDHGAVTPVQQQHPFGTCWAFAATAALEGIAVVQGRQPLQKLSEQQLVSCEPAENGGKDSDVLWGWLKEHMHGSLALERSYPYNRTCNFFREQLLAPDGTRDGYLLNCTLPSKPPSGPCPPCPGVSRSDGAPACRTKATDSTAQVSGWGYVASAPDRSDTAIVAALAKYGPGTLGIDASCLRGYQSGVVRSCATQEVDHAVTLVGAGFDGDVPYWLVKNSWGTEFGEAGFFRVERNKGLLGIRGAMFACYVPGCTINLSEEVLV